MTYKVLKRPQAEADIEDCFVYIAEDNFDAGVAFLCAVEESLEELSEFPEMGESQHFASVELRSIRRWHVKGYENYLIFYLLSEDSIELVRVLHGARDIGPLLS